MKPQTVRLDLLRSLGLLLLAIGAVQILFIRIQHIDAQKAQRVVSAILRDENSLVNPQRVSQALLDLKETGFIACTQIERHGSEAPFLARSKESSCNSAEWLLNGETISAKIPALDGHLWKISVRSVNPPIFLLTLWIARLIVIAAAGALFYWSRTRQKLHELQLTMERSKAEFAEDLARQVSHDIRSPLSAINMVTKTLTSVPSEKRLLIESATSRINGIANDLLSRYKTSPPDSPLPNENASTVHRPTLTPVPIARLLEQLAAEKTALLQDRPGLKFILDLSGPQDAVCSIDEKELGRACSNLLNNAIEAVKTSGTVVLALRSAINHVAIIVSDNGFGIPDEVLARLGKSEISAGKEKTESGSGIGVLHAARAVEQMGGKLSIQSKPGMGTIITITLPRTSRGPRRPSGGVQQHFSEVTQSRKKNGSERRT